MKRKDRFSRKPIPWNKRKVPRNKHCRFCWKLLENKDKRTMYCNDTCKTNYHTGLKNIRLQLENPNELVNRLLRGVTQRERIMADTIRQLRYKIERLETELKEKSNMKQLETKHGVISINPENFCNVYYKKVKEELHKFKKYDGYGFSIYEIEEMKRNNVNKIVIDVELKDKTHKVLVTTLEVVQAKGENYYDKWAKDRQLILAESNFKEIK